MKLGTSLRTARVEAWIVSHGAPPSAHLRGEIDNVVTQRPNNEPLNVSTRLLH